MISVLAQERLLGATLGSVLVGGIVLNQRRGIYRTISDDRPLQIYLPQRCDLSLVELLMGLYDDVGGVYMKERHNSILPASI